MENILAHLKKFRLEIMGICILWIIFFHSRVYFDDFLYPLTIIKRYGYTGVDLFFILSGFSMYFSLKEAKPLKIFYKKRVTRILPTYWCFLIVNFLIGAIFTSTELRPLTEQFFRDASLTSFFVYNEKWLWFIPAIFCCYLISPAVFTFIDAGNTLTRTVLLSTLALAFSLAITGTPVFYLLIFSLRLPTFFAGFYLGHLLHNNKELPHIVSVKSCLAVVFTCTVILIILRTYLSKLTLLETGLHWYPTILMAIPLLLLFAVLLNKFHARFPILTACLRFAGTYSLELYLVHIAVYAYGKQLQIPQSYANYHRMTEYAFYVLISIIGAIMLNKASNVTASLLRMKHR